MNRTQKGPWFYLITMLLSLALGIYIAVEIAVLRRVPVVLGRYAPSLTFWSNIVLCLALARDNLLPIWIPLMLNLGLLFAVMVVYEIAIPVLRGCAGEGEKS